MSLVVKEKLSKEDGDNNADASVYSNIIGNLLYLTTTRPNIMFAASLLFRFMHSQSQVHLGAAKRVLRYLKGTTNYDLCFLKNESRDLQVYANSDWAENVKDTKSTSDYVFFFLNFKEKHMVA